MSSAYAYTLQSNAFLPRGPVDQECFIMLRALGAGTSRAKSVERRQQPSPPSMLSKAAHHEVPYHTDTELGLPGGEII